MWLFDKIVMLADVLCVLWTKHVVTADSSFNSKTDVHSVFIGWPCINRKPLSHCQTQSDIASLITTILSGSLISYTMAF